MSSIRKRRFIMAADAYGAASTDGSLGVDAPTRFAALAGLEVSDDTYNTNSNPSQVDVYEVLGYDPADDTADTYGPLVFHVAQPRAGTYYQPRIETHTDAPDQAATTAATSGVTGEENGDLRLRSSRLRVEVSGATPSSTFYVDVFVKTGGDQRF